MQNEIQTITVPEDFEPYIDLVRRLAHSYPTNARCDFEDYVNVGLAAMAKAKELFDPNAGVKFITYAYPIVKNAIEKEWQQNANAVSGCTPYFVNKSDEDREHIRFINNTVVSLSASRKDLDLDPLKIYTQGGVPKRIRPTLKEMIVESGIDCPESFAQREEIIAKVDELIADLEPEEQDIIYRRVFQEDTFQQIADDKQLTWRTVNYRFHKSMEKLKEKLLEAGLEVYA